MLFAGVGCFAAQIVRLYRHRMRRAIDVHMPFALLAAILALAATGLLIAGVFSSAGPNDPLWVAVVWLMLFGVAETAIQGFFYKIATFLVWLKRYAPVAGTRTVPRLEEMYSRRIALIGWALWTAAIISATAAIIFEADLLAGIGLLLMSGVACFLINVIAIGRHWLRPDIRPSTAVRGPLRRPDLRTTQP
jgi:hypothetical protein